MKKYLKESIELANNFDYLDRLYAVYPISHNLRRNIPKITLDKLEHAYNSQDNLLLLKEALKLNLFPLKDSYVAFLRKDEKFIEQNPKTVDRLAGSMYELGWDKFLNNITEPKESNRQMGSAFREWIKKKPLGILPVKKDKFLKDNSNAVLDCSDDEAKNFALNEFGYDRNKGLDFVARFNGKYIIGEAKFLTDHGGHQNAQFEDAISTLNTKVNNATTIAILDGVLYIEGQNKLFQSLNQEYKDTNIISTLLLRKFCYSFT
tara:strand:+ start:1177 stop:1962 length:786 start_codon:yes stop_codon:yes gene_type:complete